MAELHVIGSSPAVPRPNRANSCYLIRTQNASIVLELGSGALAKLMTVQNPATLDAILISHMHADHFFDLVPLRYALKYEVQRPSPLPVYLPPGGMKKVNAVVSPFTHGGSFFDGILTMAEYAPNRELRIGDARITFARSRHYIEAYAMRVRSRAGTIVFSSDTAPEKRVVDLAQNADVFLCEAGLGPAAQEHGRRGHCNAKEAGAMAAHAAAKHLLLTHYPSSARASELKHAAQSEFSGKITVADDGMEIALE
jgi:ribonuclease BN (tRNA processing enzyme)